MRMQTLDNILKVSGLIENSEGQGKKIMQYD